jgi:hypothetical protein
MFDRQKSRTIKDPIEVSAPSSQAGAIKNPAPIFDISKLRNGVPF